MKPTENTEEVLIKEVTAGTITIIINGKEYKINKQLIDLQKLMKNENVQIITYENKIYNIEHINEANFGVVVSNKVFNAVLTKELFTLCKNNKKAESFINSLSPEDKDDWETKRQPFKTAQAILEESFVWVIGWQLRRLFSIGNDKAKGIETRIDEYINHCFSTYETSLQLINYIFISKLWDERSKNKNIDTNKPALKNFFCNSRRLKLGELHKLFQALIEIFRDNNLEYPVEKESFGDVNEFMQADSKFNKACIELEKLEAMDMSSETYGLAHCHTAEISLSAILSQFKFFTSYQLITIKKIEYESARNTAARYIKDLNILEKKEARKLLRLLKYDNVPTQTYSVFFQNKNQSINLFPFLLDYNALTNELDSQIFLYECMEGDSSLRYFSLQSETEETINYMATSTEFMQVTSEEQKNELQKSIRLDLVVRQFEEAMNTILGTTICFKRKESDLFADYLKNV